MLAVNETPGTVPGGTRGRWIWAVSGLLTAAALAVPAVRLAATAPAPAETAGPATLRTYTVPQAVTSVDVTTVGAPVRIAAGNAPRVEVTIAYHSKAGPPPGPGTVSGGRLTLPGSGCGVRDSGWCEDGFTLTVPRGTEVDVSTEGGPVTVSGISGTLRADTGGGPLSAQLLGSADVSATTDGGPAMLGFASAPRAVTVTSGGGPVRVLVPGGPYALNADSGGGPEYVGIATDFTAGRTLLLSTGGGPLRVAQSGG